MGQWFLVSVHQSPLGPIPRVSGLVGLGRRAREFAFLPSFQVMVMLWILPSIQGDQMLLEESPSSEW